MALALAGVPALAAAQSAGGLLPPDSVLSTLWTGPRDPAHKVVVVHDAGITGFDTGLAGEVALAEAQPLWLTVSDRGDSLVVGAEAAVFARFSLAVANADLINTDWTFALPVVWRRGGHWLRFRYYHISSHLGDEYQRRFGRASVNFYRDGFDLTGYIRPTATAARRAGLGIYGMIFRAVQAGPGPRAFWSGRAGMEVDPGRGSAWSPVAALDLAVAQNVRPRWSVLLGLWLPHGSGRRLRLQGAIVTGPSVMGQFTPAAAEQLSLGLAWSP